MDILGLLIPAALFLGLVGLAAFMWALKNGQFDDLDGAAMRILIDDESSKKSPPAADGDRKDRPAARP
ncbi:MAG TPA: cbb3-type cytochrome oxidase assembly protein CcoS [Rhodospirillales bacterium]|jgi:cbb3-type cytochrome oxidase maturation protein